MIKGMSQKAQARKTGLNNAKLPRPSVSFIKNTLADSLVGAEIGVLLGKNAESILQTLNIKKLYLIDPYIHYKENVHHIAQDFPAALVRVIEKLSRFKDKIVWVKKKSSDAVADVPDDLDFVYIDGNHTYPYVKADLENYWPKIKKGGILAGHDYFLSSIMIKNKVVPKIEVKKAVDEFVQKNNVKLTLKAPDFWIVK